MIVLQIIVTLFIVAILYKLFRQRQSGKMSILGFVVWFLLWLVVLIVFWQPETTTYLANWLGIGRGADLAVYLSILVIFYLIFRIYVRIEKMEKDITKVVRHVALGGNEDEDKNS